MHHEIMKARHTPRLCTAAVVAAASAFFAASCGTAPPTLVSAPQSPPPTVIPAGAGPETALVTDVNPSSAVTTGGTVIRIEGYGLGSATKVMFGTSSAAISSVKLDPPAVLGATPKTVLTVVAPSHPVDNKVNLAVTGAAGNLAVLKGGFSFALKPAAPTPTCQELTATESYPPLNPMPAPGHMPAGSWMANIVTRGFLLAGVDQNTNLWGYRDPVTGELDGFDIELVHQVALAIFGGDPSTIAKRHIIFVPIANAARMTAINRKSDPVDLVAFTMTINCEREQQSLMDGPVDFSTDYFDAGQQILVPAYGSTIVGPKDLAKKKVCATAGSTSLANLFALAPESADKWAVVNQTDCLVMLQQNQVDAISTDNTILQGLQAQDPNTRLVGPLFSHEPYGMAISKHHTDFTQFVNGVLANVKANGTWSALYRQFILPSAPNEPVPAPPAPKYKPLPVP
jgi:polar amino acid transport system substrate-binding protein